MQPKRIVLRNIFRAVISLFWHGSESSCRHHGCIILITFVPTAATVLQEYTYIKNDVEYCKTATTVFLVITVKQPIFKIGSFLNFKPSPYGWGYSRSLRCPGDVGAAAGGHQQRRA